MATQLTEREKQLLMGGGILVIVALIFWGVGFIFSWLNGIKDEKNGMLNARQKIEVYGKEYNLLKELEQQIGSKTQKIDITPIIEDLLNDHQLGDKASNVNPSTSTVQKKYQKHIVSISLREVSANSFLSFLKAVEDYSGAFLKVDHVNTRPVLRKPGLYNCQIKIATFVKKS